MTTTRIPKSNKQKVILSTYCDDQLAATTQTGKVDDLFYTTLEVLVRNNPDKIVLSLKEAAKQLTIGEEFLRRRIKSGKIKVTYFGDKPLINIVELARIITEGV